MSDNPMMPQPNTVCWRELMTSDIEGAKKFYGALLGWTSETKEPFPGFEYVVFSTKEGIPAAGCMLNKDPQGNDIPPNWGQYISVKSADDAAATAKAAGGTPCTDFMQIENVGRFIIVKDPGGAAMGFWQDLTGAC